MSRKKSPSRTTTPPHEPRPPQPSQPASFKDVYQTVRKLEGEQISPKALLDSGEEFIVYRFSTRQSQFGGGEYAAVEIERLNPKGERRYYFSASSVMVEQLQRVQDRLPLRTRLVQKQSSTGRSYFSLD